jgi:ABC-2 type transport system ATP-binding protein
MQNSTQTETAAVQVDNLSLAFKSNVVFKNASMSLPSGQIGGIVGSNGCGKTTLLKLIMGMILPRNGSIRVFGEDVSLSAKSHRENISVLVDGNRCLYWEINGRENIEYFAILKSKNGIPDRENIVRLIKQFDVESFIDMPVSKISKGMKQKIMLIIALLSSPKLLILDEPINGLDYQSVQTLKEGLWQLRDNGLSILMTSHDRYFLDEMCDCQYLIRDREISARAETEYAGERKMRYYIQLLESVVQKYIGMGAVVADARKSVYFIDATLNHSELFTSLGNDIEKGECIVVAIIEPGQLAVGADVPNEDAVKKGIQVKVGKVK